MNLRYSDGQPSNGTPLKRFYQRYEKPLLAISAMVVFLSFWEILPSIGLANPFFTSSPSRIWRAALWLSANGLGTDIRVSLWEFTAGFVLALILSIPLGLLLGWYRRLNAMFEPFVSMLNATPRIALLPLIILWLGIGIESKIAAVFLGAFFPILINIMAGVNTIDENLLKCARSFGARDGQVFATLALPSSIPFIMAGMRLAIGRGLVGVVVGEMMAAQYGVGHMMAMSSAMFQTDRVYVGLILLTGFGYILTEMAKRLEKHFETWRS
jgi:ABC-type nitrate/sulfonate/bicarbonate transport system permease component